MNDFHGTREPGLKKIQAYIARMPSLSTSVIKVLETCNDPHSSANDLKRVISLDPVLTGRVLKLINSAYYSLGKPITSLTRAIIMLGVNTVKNLALSFTILATIKGHSSCAAFSEEDFWRHCLCVGVVAKALAALIGVPVTGQEEFFIAGLLHDLGKIPLRMQFPKEYCRICETVQDGQQALYRSEAEYLGVDHGAVGCFIAKKWRLGAVLVESLSHHHSPADGSEEHRRFVSVVALANQLALHFNVGNAGDHFADQRLVALLMGQIGVDWTMVEDLQAAVAGEIERAKFFLEVIQNG
jgi:HD-like signal output (HDOD) protein